GAEARQKLLEQVKREEAQAAKMVPPREEFDDGIKKIFELAENGSDAHEIAFRIFKHQYAGFQIAKGWWVNPEGSSAMLLSTLRARNEMKITNERIIEIANAIKECRDFIGTGTDMLEKAEQYREAHGIKLPMPKPQRPAQQQSAVNVDGRNTDSFGDGQEEDVPSRAAPPTRPADTTSTENDKPGNWVQNVVKADEDSGQPRPASEWASEVTTSEDTEEPEAVAAKVQIVEEPENV
ncbi:MAG: hypothetical protein ACWGQW_19225, partial [bacterium]